MGIRTAFLDESTEFFKHLTVFLARGKLPNGWPASSEFSIRGRFIL
jgi:hypothetical protein